MNNMNKEQPTFQTPSLHNYILDIQIGHGASSICYKALSKLDKKIYAIKKISINTIKGNNLKFALKQVDVLKRLQHPNIIKYHESFTDQHYLYIVMEYAPKGDLHTILNRRKIKHHYYTQPQLWSMSSQLLQALQYLHSQNIIHRDIKTLNIFLNNQNHLLIGDLGVSKIIHNDLGLYSRVGTPLYLPPEIIKYQKYDYKADIWGFGCVMYVLASLSHPFQGKNIINLGKNILFTHPKSLPSYSDKLNTMITLALQKNPLKRPDANTLYSLFYSQFNYQNQCNIQQKLSIQRNITMENQCQNKHNKLFDFCQNNNNNHNFQKITPHQHKIKTNLKTQHQQQIQINKQDETLLLGHPYKNPPTDGNTHQITRVKNNFIGKWKQSNQLLHFHKRQSFKIITPVSQPFAKIIHTARKQLTYKNHHQQQQPRLNSQPIQYFKEKQPKLNSQPIQYFKDSVKLQDFIKPRHIQSATLKPLVVVTKQHNVTNQKISNQRNERGKSYCISQALHQFHPEPPKIPSDNKTRPKSSIGRRMIATNNAPKHIKKNKAIFLQTKIEFLKTPEYIII